MTTAANNEWMLNIPTDMMVYFFIRMDLGMIDSLLDDHQSYIGKTKTEFIDWLEKEFEIHRQSGDTGLPILRGVYTNEQGEKIASFSFEGNHSKRRLDFILVTDEKMKILNMISNPTFVFDEFIYSVE